MRSFFGTIREIFRVFLDAVLFLGLCLRPTAALSAENLFLRRQLGLFIERRWLSSSQIRWSDGIVEDSASFGNGNPSREVGPACPVICGSSSLKWRRAIRPGVKNVSPTSCSYGISISPRTLRRYMPRSPKRPAPSQRWMTFVRNHAKATIASDFFVVVTATFQLVYVFLIMEVGTRRIRHVHVTRHPTAEWTLQQFRECITGGEGYKFIIHDRDDIYSKVLDASLKTFGLRVLRTPYRSPQANSFCERLIGSARRECLDFMIPLDTAHVGQIMKTWAAHYNRGRPHRSLGPGIPDAPAQVERQEQRHRIPDGHRIVVKPILGGLHHEYRLERVAA